MLALGSFQWLADGAVGVTCSIATPAPGTEQDPAIVAAQFAAQQCPDKCDDIQYVLGNYFGEQLKEIQARTDLQKMTPQQISASAPTRPSYSTFYYTMRPLCPTAIAAAPAPVIGAAPTTAKAGGGGGAALLIGALVVLGVVGAALAGRA